MRRIIIYVLGFVLLCFTIPIIFTNKPKENEVEVALEENTIQEENKLYTYTNYGTVRLLHSQTGEVETLAMDEYLYRSSICRDASKF